MLLLFFIQEPILTVPSHSLYPRKPLYLKRFFIDNTHMLRYYRRSVYEGFKGFLRY